MAKRSFTFYLKTGHALNALQSDGEKPHFTVYATSYEVAVRKILKMNIPHIEENDLIIQKIEESNE